MINRDHINHLFIEIMNIVKQRRKLRFLEDRLEQNRSRYNTDPRLVALLDNEYERSLEEREYKMKTLSELVELIRKSDDGEDDQ